MTEPLDRTWFHRQWRHVRLWRRFLAQAVVRETHYRVHFLTTLLVGLVELGLGVVPLLLLFGFTDEVRGWSRAEVIAVVGMYQIANGLLGTFIAPNLNRMTRYITEGELDVVLLRPVSSQFYLLLRWINIAELSTVATGIVVLAAGLSQAGVSPSAAEIAQAVVLAGSGFVLLVCFWCALSLLAFWLQSVEAISYIFLNLIESGRYPVGFFPVAVRAFFTFAFPVAFATTFPVEALSGGVGWTFVGGGLLMVAAAVAGVRLLWRRGIRSYASASS